jgi:hypothetical protein
MLAPLDTRGEMGAQELSKFDVEDHILKSLKKRDGVATAGDVAADTGLGYGNVETALRRMLSKYKSHLDVDDDGNLRYRFDPGFVKRGEDPGRFWHDLRRTLWNGFKWFFKVWIMVTLVGYTIIFILLLIALAVAGIAASASSDSDSDGLIELPFYLLARVLETLFWINLFDDRRYGGRRRRRRRRGRSRLHRKAKKPDKAFYQKVFDFVFGPETKPNPLKAQTAFTQFVREMNGRVTAADWAARTGQSLDEAENALTAAIVRFNGDVDVSDEGHLVYRFDELMVTAGAGQRTSRGPDKIWNVRKKVPGFTGNPTSTNVWISIFNTFNLVMSGFILTGAGDALAQGVAVDPAVLYGLGIVPAVFSVIFFAVPALRWIGHARQKNKVEKENVRRREIGRIYESVQGAQAEPIQLEAKVDTELVAGFDGDVQVDDAGTAYYFFGELKSELDAGERARQAASGQVVFGQTVFSSDEEEKSLEEAELEEFDKRLARELEGSHVEFDVAVPETVGVN